MWIKLCKGKPSCRFEKYNLEEDAVYTDAIALCVSPSKVVVILKQISEFMFSFQGVKKQWELHWLLDLTP